MECPTCKTKDHVEVDLHAEGFAQDALECGGCGCIWTYSGSELKIIKERDRKQQSPNFTCPSCDCEVRVELDLHAEGFAKGILECGDCGCVWTCSDGNIKIIKESDTPVETFASFVCPTCKQRLSKETDLDSYQFHEEFYECTNCGTTCSSAHNQIEVIKDSQLGSFLSATTELVEADDYVFS